ncbi:MAG TPA: YtxH domain-containing protein [Gemmatimonadales bacterium]|nr:YtxH domain-containing protein [Gemmatimonadales bacterium]
MRRRHVPEVVYVERGGGDSSVKSLLWGMAIGAGLALLYAPRNGEETRRSLQRSLWKLRAMTEEKLDELVTQYGPGRRGGGPGGRGGADAAAGEFDERYADAYDDDDELDEDDELDDDVDAALETEGPPLAASSERAELERRLAEARARRRAAADLEEPLA